MHTAYTCNVNVTDTHLEIEMKVVNGAKYRYHTPLMHEEVAYCPQYIKEFIEQVLEKQKK